MGKKKTDYTYEELVAIEDREREAAQVVLTRRAEVVEELTQIAGGELRSRQVRALMVAVASYIVELEGRIERLEGDRSKTTFHQTLTRGIRDV